jgi:uncharacterized protein (DUF302 family)
MKQLILTICALFTAASIQAQEAVVYDYDGSFDDATFSVEDAIVSKGLVIDYISHTGEMLKRTGDDLGTTKEIFKDADIFLFCSAVLSRKVMEINPMNIVHCPYTIFVFENQDGVKIGFNKYPEGEMQQVQVLLDGIVQSALE